MGSTLIMIFFTENIKPFKAASGVNIVPCECQLKDGRTGYFLGVDWAIEIVSLGVSIEPITKDDLKVEEDVWYT